MAKKGKSPVSKIITTLVILAALGVGSYYILVPRPEKPPELVSANIARGTITQVVTASGELSPVVVVEISSQISGIIDAVYVDFNSTVEAGQVIAKLNSDTYQANVRQAEVELGNARASFELARLNAERVRSLQERQLVSQAELDQSLASLQQAEASVKIREFALERATLDLTRCTIYSPIDGIVISRQAEVGKTVAASLSAPTLFVIANDLSKMQIKANVSEADIGIVEEGQQVRFTVDAFPARPFSGTVAQIRNSPRTADGVVAYETIIDVSNPDLRLKPGMTANVSIVVAEKTNVLRISNAALRIRLPEGLALPAVTPPAAAPTAVAARGTDGNGETGQPPAGERLRGAGGPGGAGGFAADPERMERMRSRMAAGGGGMGGPGGGGFTRGGGAGGSTFGGTVTTRTVYQLPAAAPKNARPQAVNVRLGITDGSFTEIIDGLSEGDLVVTGLALAGTQAATSSPAGTNNPFAGGGRGMGGRRF